MTGRVTPSGPSLAAWAVIVLLFHLVEPVPAATLEGAAQRGLQQFGQHLSEYSQGKRRKADQTTLIRSWQTELGPLVEQLEPIDDETLKLIYRDTDAAVYYTHDPHIAATLPRISRELDSRDRDLDPMRGNPTVGNHRQATYHALINARLFTQAADFKADQGEGVTPFPALVDAAALASMERVDGPALFKVEARGDAPALIASAADVGHGDWFIAVVHPWCGFSKAAMDVLDVDEEFRALLPENTVWFSGQGDTARIAPIVEWNRQSTVIDIALAYRNVDWVDLIDLSETPQFYLIRDGRVLRHIKGWPDDTRRHALNDDLREVFGSGMPQRATSQDQPADPDD